MSRHHTDATAPYIFFFIATFILGAILPLFWLWFLPTYSVGFNTLVTRTGIAPFDSLMLMEFFGWPVVMIVFMKGAMR